MTTPTTNVGSNRRRQSDDGRQVLGTVAAAAGAATSQNRRRVTIQAIPTSASLVSGRALLDTSVNTTAHETPSKQLSSKKTPSKHRINLGTAVSNYFFTPGKNALSAKKTGQENALFHRLDHNESVNSTALSKNWINAAKSPGMSFLTTNSDESSSSGDLLNASAMSDPTELTASSYIKVMDSKQRPKPFSFTQPSPAAALEEIKEVPQPLPPTVPNRPQLGMLEDNDHYQPFSLPMSSIPKPSVNRRASSPIIIAATTLLQRAGGSVNRRGSIGDTSLDSSKLSIEQEAVRNMNAKIKNGSAQRQEARNRRLSAASANSGTKKRLSMSLGQAVASARRNSLDSNLAPLTPQDSVALSSLASPMDDSRVNTDLLLHQSTSTSADHASVDKLVLRGVEESSRIVKTPNHRKSLSASHGDGAPTPSSVLTDVSPASSKKDRRSWSIDKDLIQESYPMDEDGSKRLSQSSDAMSISTLEEIVTFSQPSAASQSESSAASAVAESSAKKSNDQFCSPPPRSLAKRRKSPASTASPVVLTRSAARRAHLQDSEEKLPITSMEDDKRRRLLNSPAGGVQQDFRAISTPQSASSLPRILESSTEDITMQVTNELTTEIVSKSEYQEATVSISQINLDETASTQDYMNTSQEGNSLTPKRRNSIVARSDRRKSNASRLHELHSVEAPRETNGAEDIQSASRKNARKRKNSPAKRLSDAFSQVAGALSSPEQLDEVQESSDKRRKGNEATSPFTKLSNRNKASPKSPFSKVASPAKRTKSPAKFSSPAPVDSPAFNTRRARKSISAADDGAGKSAEHGEYPTLKSDTERKSLMKAVDATSGAAAIKNLSAPSCDIRSSEVASGDETASFDDIEALFGENVGSSKRRSSVTKTSNSRDTASTTELVALKALIESRGSEQSDWSDEKRLSTLTSKNPYPEASPMRQLKSPAKLTPSALNDSPAFHTRRAASIAKAASVSSNDTVSEDQLASLFGLDESGSADTRPVARDPSTTVELADVLTLFAEDSAHNVRQKTKSPAAKRLCESVSTNETETEDRLAVSTQLSPGRSGPPFRTSSPLGKPTDAHDVELSETGSAMNKLLRSSEKRKKSPPRSLFRRKNQVTSRPMVDQSYEGHFGQESASTGDHSHRLNDHSLLSRSPAALTLLRDHAMSSSAHGKRIGREEKFQKSTEAKSHLDETDVQASAVKCKELEDETASVDQIAAFMGHDDSFELKSGRSSEATFEVSLSEAKDACEGSDHLPNHIAQTLSSKSVVSLSEKQVLHLQLETGDSSTKEKAGQICQSLAVPVTSPSTSNSMVVTTEFGESPSIAVDRVSSTVNSASPNDMSLDSVEETVSGADTFRQMNVEASPQCGDILPTLKSILNSSRKTNPSPFILGPAEVLAHKRSVAFGSPQAALFNISSPPSSRLTPMPAMRAKKLYLMPDATSSLSPSPSESSNISGGNSKTVEIEASITDIPLPEGKSLSFAKGSINREEGTPNGSLLDEGVSASLGNDETVGLESTLVGLPSPSDANERKSTVSKTDIEGSDPVSPAISVEMSDANSIKTANFSTEQVNYPVLIGAKKLEFDGEPTAELDGSLLCLVQNADIPYKMNLKSSSEHASRLSFPAKLKSSFVGTSGRMSLGDGTVDGDGSFDDAGSFKESGANAIYGDLEPNDGPGDRLDFSESSADSCLLEVTNAEIVRLAGIDESQKFQVIFDTLAAFIEAIRSSREHPVLGSLHALTEEVCSSLSNQTPHDADWDSQLAMHYLKNPDSLIAIQESIRLEKNEEVSHAFKLIASRSQRYVDVTWEVWSASLGDSLSRIIEEESALLADNQSALRAKVGLLAETEETIASIRRSQRRIARRTTLNRRKVRITE